MNMLTRARMMMAGTAIACVTFITVPSVALAQDDTEIVTPNVVDGGEYIVSSQMWKVITGLLLPVVIALLTKVNARPLVKGAVSIVVAFLDALVLRAVTLPDGAAMFTQAMIEDVVYIYAIQFLAYFGIYRTPQVRIGTRVAPNAGLS